MQTQRVLTSTLDRGEWSMPCPANVMYHTYYSFQLHTVHGPNIITALVTEASNIYYNFFSVNK